MKRSIFFQLLVGVLLAKPAAATQCPYDRILNVEHVLEMISDHFVQFGLNPRLVNSLGVNQVASLIEAFGTPAEARKARELQGKDGWTTEIYDLGKAVFSRVVSQRGSLQESLKHIELRPEYYPVKVDDTEKYVQFEQGSGRFGPDFSKLYITVTRGWSSVSVVPLELKGSKGNLKNGSAIYQARVEFPTGWKEVSVRVSWSNDHPAHIASVEATPWELDPPR